MKPSSQRLIVILGSFGLFVATIYMATSLVFPVYRDEIKELRSQIETRKNVLATQTEVAEKVDILLKEFGVAGLTSGILSQMLPTSPDAPEILNNMDGLANLSGLDLNSVSFQFSALTPAGRGKKEAILRGVGTIRVGLSLNGEYGELKKFLKLLGENARIFDLSTIKIEGGGQSEDAGSNFDYNIEVKAYYQT